MQLDRRHFIQLGVAAAFAGSGCDGSSKPSAPAPAGTTTAGSGKPDYLTIGFEGLYVIEEKGSSMLVHLVDATAVGMPAHLARLKALASTIDQAQTAKPDPAHIIPVGRGDEYWLWDLKGYAVTTPPSEKGGDDLTKPNNSSEDGVDIPTTDAGWNSLARVPDLRVCCGASKITNTAALASSVTLTHGQLDVLKPADAIGSKAVWKFTDPATGKELMRRALSNTVQYSCPTSGKSLVIRVGTQDIVFKPAAAAVSIENLPTIKAPRCPQPCTPTMNHFKALCKVVDATIDPTIALAVAFSPGTNVEAGADYCPGGRA